MYSVVTLTESIRFDLSEKINKISIRFKSSDNTDEYIETKPKVYAWTYDDLSAGYPLHTPSILVQLVNVNDDMSADYIVHVCTCNPALQDKEITTQDNVNPDLYKYGTSDDINTSNIRSELYKSCVELGEYVLICIKQMSNDNYSFNNITLDTPSPYMDDFPYCQCSISFTANKSHMQSSINTKVWDLV